MTTNADEQFDAFLREGLRADPVLPPIPNLPERAIALAMTVQTSSARASYGTPMRSNPRILSVCTALAGLAILCIVVWGGWSLLHTGSMYSASNFSSNEYSNGGAFYDAGFAAAMLAVVMLLVALLGGWIMDALSIEANSGDLLTMSRLVN